MSRIYYLCHVSEKKLRKHTDQYTNLHIFINLHQKQQTKKRCVKNHCNHVKIQSSSKKESY